ncbi:hypothetical protein FKR81_35770 [Lentzea tibetensis]|uniref:Uncharacterized protein n=1 Tax=Lentzea tibetensis TaxID=2591470 RepID=A0A563EIK7_9PSEU|nr:hypothetical protein [Lentzea tibetensis]TWP46522.1 hypothetical protein FKR81_35770 [Lentzea tibetensis]
MRHDPAMDVSRWVAAAVPWWVTRVVLVAGWLAAVIVAVSSSTVTCTPDVPCSPDTVFAMALVLLLATPVLLFWMPVTGCLAGVGFAVLDLLFDDLPVAQVAFGLHGFCCAVVALWILRSRATQRQIAGGSAVRLSGDLPWGVSPLMALLCFAAAAWAFLSYDAAAASIESHVLAATRVEGQIVEVRPTGLTVELPDRQRVPVAAVADQYHVGDRVPLLADDTWVRLVAEPEDATWRLTLGSALCLAVFLLVVRTWHRRSLWSRPLPSLPLAVESVGAHRVLLSSSGGAFALLRVDADVPSAPPRFTDAAHFGRVWRGEEPPPPEPDLPVVTVAGELCHGGRVVLLLGDEVLLSSVLRPFRRALDHSLPGTPVSAGSPGTVPRVIRWGLTEGLLLLGLAVLFWFYAVPVGALCLAGAWMRLQPQMRLEHTVLVLRVGLYVYRVPWPQLHGVRLAGDRLVLAYGPSGDLVTVPSLPGLGSELMGLRARALIADGSAAVTRTLGPVPIAVLAYLVVGWFL